MTAITSFKGAYAFLSNFTPAVVRLPGSDRKYPTVEHAYQAAKTTDDDTRYAIWSARTPGRAKRLGQKVQIRPDWEDVKLGVMLGLLRQKFGDHEVLQTQLLATGDMDLVEGNGWGDTYWGVCAGVGENHLGQLLMQVRREIRQRYLIPAKSTDYFRLMHAALEGAYEAAQAVLSDENAGYDAKVDVLVDIGDALAPFHGPYCARCGWTPRQDPARTWAYSVPRRICDVCAPTYEASLETPP